MSWARSGNGRVELTPHYAVKVDEYSRSTVDNIYAVGDVTNRLNLTPVAIREGHAFADTVFGGRDIKVDHTNVPTAVFSQPEIGTVGMTEAQAREATAKIDIYKTSFRPMRHTMSGRDERMLMKLVVDGGSDKVLGCHIVGPDAGEMAQLARHRRQDGRDQGRFRRHHGAAPDGGRGTGHHAPEMEWLACPGNKPVSPLYQE